LKRFPGLVSLGVVEGTTALRATSPSRADGPLRVETASDVYFEISAVDLGASTGEKVDDAWVFPGARSGLDVARIVTTTRVEELRLAHDLESARESRYRWKTGPAIASTRVRDGRVELLDREGRIRFSSEPAFAVDATGKRRSLAVRASGDLLVFSLDTAGLVAPIAIDPAWTATGSVGVARYAAKAVTLKSGKVLVAGGSSLSAPIGAPELYDPTTKTWTAAGTMLSPRRGFAMTVLDDGRVLAVGGAVDGTDTPTASAEIYNPATNTWSAAASLPNGRRDLSSVLLPSKKVMIIGGNLTTGTPTNARELPIYDPVANSWSKSAALMAHARSNGDAISLSDGRVFILGGYETAGGVRTLTDQPELYAPATDTIKQLTRPPTARMLGYIAEITSGTKKGKILQLGGTSDPEGAGESFANTTLYDLATDTWSSAASMTTKRASFDGFAIGSKFLVAGGYSNLGATALTTNDSSELYDPETNTWTDAGKLSSARAISAQALLADGSALVIGGAVSFDGAFLTPTAAVDRFALVADAGVCSTGSECASGSCVEGHCCKSTACGAYACASGTCGTTCTTTSDCATGNYCDTATHACVAQKAVASACGGVDQCLSGHCVDGVCCDSACTDQCAACDVSGHVGQCFAVKGLAHGSRTACMVDAANPCASAVCDGLDVTRCAGVPGAEVVCRTASCTSGVATASAACSAGKCPAEASTPCNEYKCGPTACKTMCASDDDCAADYACNGGSCVPKTSKCTSETQMLTSDGKTVECAPYVCRDKRCLDKCTSSVDCVAGSACESGACTAVAPSTDDSSGGCTMVPGRGGAAGGAAGVFALALALIGTRRRR
jgi:N-acetylneuraminic acid mutarotase